MTLWPESHGEPTAGMKEWLVSLIGNAPFAIAAFDFDGSCVLANAGAADVFGLAPDDLVDRSFHEVFSDWEELQTHVGELMRVGRADFDRAEMSYRDRVYDVRGRTVVDGMLLTFNDITQAVASRLERERLVRHLQEANRGLEEFAYISAHDMKSPIASLVGLVDRLKQSGGVRPEAEEVFHMVERSVHGLSRTVRSLNEILDLRKSLRGRGEETCSVDEVLDEVLVALEAVIESSGATVGRDLAGSSRLPLASAHLRSVLLNLIDNAIKYAGDGDPEIEVRSRHDGSGTQLEVSDRGLGIDLQRHGDRVFGLFNRFHPGVDGAGIGLYLVKAIVEACDGEVMVESQLGSGTLFRICIPDEAHG